MTSHVISHLALELRRRPEPSRRSEIVGSLDLLLRIPSDQAQAPLILRLLLKELQRESTLQEPGLTLFGADILETISQVSRHIQSTDGPRLIADLTDPRVLFDWIWARSSFLDLPNDEPLRVGIHDARAKANYISATVDILSLYSSHPTLLHISTTNRDTAFVLIASRLWYLWASGIEKSISASILSIYRAFLECETSIHTPDEHFAALGMAAAVRHILYLVQEMETIGVAGLDAAVDEAIVLLLDGSTAGFITSNASPPDLDSIAAHLGIIVALSRSPRCSHALANRHSPRIVVKVLTLLSDLSPSHSDLDAAVACATLCVEHLCIILENTSGFGAILEAVDTLLLPVLIKCYVHFPHLNNLPPTKSDAAFLLSHVLSKYLVYISIRDPVSKSLDVIAENGYVTRLAPQTSFTRAWLDFSSLLSERMQVPARYFRQENQVVCNNITCRKMNAKAGLSCCRHCLRAFYCSKSCQKNDWKFGGHKEVCNRRLPGNMEFCMPVPGYS